MHRNSSERRSVPERFRALVALLLLSGYALVILGCTSPDADVTPPDEAGRDDATDRVTFEPTAPQVLSVAELERYVDTAAPAILDRYPYLKSMTSRGGNPPVLELVVAGNAALAEHFATRVIDEEVAAGVRIVVSLLPPEVHVGDGG